MDDNVTRFLRETDPAREDFAPGQQEQPVKCCIYHASAVNRKQRREADRLCPAMRRPALSGIMQPDYRGAMTPPIGPVPEGPADGGGLRY